MKKNKRKNKFNFDK